MKETTNEELMTAVSNGDLDMLKILFERHHVHMFNFLYKMCGDKMLSEDLTQEVFYKLMKYRTSYNNGNFTSWMFTIARNSLKTHFRRSTENHESIDTISYRLEDEQKDTDETYTHLQTALSRLSATDRELIVLNRYQEIKYKEIAEIVGSSPGAVKTKVSRAIQKLKAIYFTEL
ncbi:RNA polymerase sigma factor [Maribacter sp. R77961]|uniref:RNA polymerase sigma factor n=1 Tax=Maribacter sp. R77961 TaxID=3093871 RepID=UPI0037C973D7